MKMSRATKILGFSVPPTVVREVELLAKAERRTKSELFREMVRVYQRYKEQRERDEERWIKGVIEEAKAEESRRGISARAMVAEDVQLARYGEKQAKKRGITPKDVNRVIHEYRKNRKA
jgi:metal-responsive CopG/Arc/MetJ family transcriptional regulator